MLSVRTLNPRRPAHILQKLCFHMTLQDLNKVVMSHLHSHRPQPCPQVPDFITAGHQHPHHAQTNTDLHLRVILFAGDDLWLCCPDTGREIVPPLRRLNRQESLLCWPTLLFALSDGGTSRPADVLEWSARTGLCGLTCVSGFFFFV